MRDEDGLIYQPGGVGSGEGYTDPAEQIRERVRKVNALLRNEKERRVSAFATDAASYLTETYAPNPDGSGYARACDTCFRVGCLNPAHRGEAPAIDVRATPAGESPIESDSYLASRFLRVE